jgi:hypothetical protein
MAVFSASRLRTGAAAVTATAIVLLVVVGLGNQGVASWRNTQAGGKNGWVAVIFQTLQYTAWRFTSGSATTQHWLAPLVFNGVFIIATALLAGAAAHNRTRFTLFLGIWGAVLLAGGLAGIAATPLVFSGTGGASADNFRTSLNFGLLLGFMIGFVAAVVSAILAGGRGSGQRGASRSQAQTVAVPDTGDTTWPLSS